MLSRGDFALPNSRNEEPDHSPQINQFEIKKAEMALINFAKETIRSMKLSDGSIACPRCHKTLIFQFIPETDLFLLKCSTDGCIDIDELEV